VMTRLRDLPPFRSFGSAAPHWSAKRGRSASCSPCRIWCRQRKRNGRKIGRDRCAGRSPLPQNLSAAHARTSGSFWLLSRALRSGSWSLPRAFRRDAGAHRKPGPCSPSPRKARSMRFVRRSMRRFARSRRKTAAIGNR
jgi:hypothetical protein